MTIGAVVLMAGLSRRLPEKNKLLLPLEGASVASRTIEILRNAGFSPILVVTGHEAGKIREELHDFDVSFLHNENYQEGMGTSIAKAMEKTKGWAGALIAMGDMPFVSVSLLRAIREAFQRDPSTIVAPINGERRGQPVLFSALFFPALAQCSGDIGGRQIIKDNTERLRVVETREKSIFWDIDTHQDLEEYRKESRDE